MKLLFENWRKFLKEDDKLLNEGVWDTLTKERSWFDYYDPASGPEISDEEWKDFIGEQQNAKTWLENLERMDPNWMEELRKAWPLKRPGGSAAKRSPEKGKSVSPRDFYGNFVSNEENYGFFSYYAERRYLKPRDFNRPDYVNDILIKDVDMRLKQKIKRWGEEMTDYPANKDYPTQVRKSQREAFLHIKTFLQFYGEFLRDVYCFFKPETLGCELDLTSRPGRIEETK